MGKFRRHPTGTSFEIMIGNYPAMLARPQVTFLQEKIKELRQALFINTSEAVFKLPTSVINALHVDDVGQVWFLIARPPQNINEFDNYIPSKLEFYRKGKNFYLHVWGQAAMVIDPDEIHAASDISEEVKQYDFSKMMLVKMKITHIHYYSYPGLHKAAKRQPVKINWNPSAFIKTLQYIVKDIIPVFQSH